jgi:thymidylate synthase (FAD)
VQVELLDSMGSDLDIVNAARVSYAKESDWEYFVAGTPTPPTLKESDRGLINYLMRNRHGTPFEMVQFKFRVKCPIGVSREWMRHRIGSFNEVSTRYVEMEPDFYVPPVEAVRCQMGKPGHYRMEPAPEKAAAEARIVMRAAYEGAYDRYKDLLNRGVAKELARNVLPLGLMTTFIWSVNLRSLFNFLSLRTHETALLETRQLALRVEDEVQKVVPVSYLAWADNNRVAP